MGSWLQLWTGTMQLCQWSFSQGQSYELMESARAWQHDLGQRLKQCAMPNKPVHILSCSLLWLGQNPPPNIPTVYLWWKSLPSTKMVDSRHSRHYQVEVCSAKFWRAKDLRLISWVCAIHHPSGWKSHGNATVISRLLTCQHGGIPLQRTPGEYNTSMVRSLASWSIWLGPGRLSTQTCTCTKQGQKRLLLSMPWCWQIRRNSPCLNCIPSTFNTLSAQHGMVADFFNFPSYCIINGNGVVTNSSKSSCVLTARSISLSTLIAWEKDSLPHNAGICRNDSMHGAQQWNHEHDFWDMMYTTNLQYVCGLLSGKKTW